MDVLQRVRDLSNLALDDRGSDHERLQAAVGALRLIKQYELLGKKRIDVATNILDKITSPDFVEGIASRAEKIADSLGRVMGSAKKMTGTLSRAGGGGEERRVRRRRRY
jgi:hypothetical protein